MKKGHPHVFTLTLWMPYRSALEWTRTTTPLGTGPQPAAYTIPPRGLTLIDYTCILHLSWRFVNGLCAFFGRPSESFCLIFASQKLSDGLLKKPLLEDTQWQI